jgi:flagellar biosynthesis/type III secretory pathway protein FliH
VSFRSFLYEDFDQTAQAAIAGALNGAAAAMPAHEPRRYREIDIVRREGFEAGRAQGRAEGRQAALEEAEGQLARDLPDLLASLGGAAADLARAKRACERDAARLAAAALRQILPIVAGRGLGREIAALVAEVVANVPGPEIEVRAAPHTLEAIARRCGPLPSAVALVSDASVPEGGVRCRWTNGEARFDGAAVTEAVLAILDRCLRDPDKAPAPALENAGQQKEE